MIHQEYDGDPGVVFFGEELWTAREKTARGKKGVGAETADSILLYACKPALFFVCRYLHSPDFFSRHDLVSGRVRLPGVCRIFFYG